MNLYRAEINCSYIVDFYAEPTDDIEFLAETCEDYSLSNLSDFDCISYEILEEDIDDEYDKECTEDDEVGEY